MNNNLINILSSSFSAIVARLATHPLDSLKVRLQLERVNFIQDEESLSTFQKLKKIISEEGFLCLYEGLTVALIFSVPALTVYLFSYDFFKNYLIFQFDSNDGSCLIQLTSGALAECVSEILWCPMELIKTKLQSQKVLFRTDASIDPAEENVVVFEGNESRSLLQDGEIADYSTIANEDIINANSKDKDVHFYCNNLSTAEVIKLTYEEEGILGMKSIE
ncbi:hypothetical protein HDU92_000953 [Lobulomyces angularis]|nr:hypothetical protein HDU92_000953 [Lobulomyces angularis]